MEERDYLTVRNKWFKYAVWSAIFWVFGIILAITGAHMEVQKIIKFREVGPAVKLFGGILIGLSWLGILFFATLVILSGLPLSERGQKLGFICGMLCILIPVAGVFMAWKIYFKK